MVQRSFPPSEVDFEVFDIVFGLEFGNVNNAQAIRFLPIWRQFDLILLKLIAKELNFLLLVIVIGNSIPNFPLAFGSLVFLDVGGLMLD